MAEFHRARDRAARPAYDFTAMLSRLAPPRPAELALFTALTRNSEYANMFIAALTGAIPMRRFMSPAVIVKLIGVRGLFALLRGARDGKAAGTPAVVTT